MKTPQPLLPYLTTWFKPHFSVIFFSENLYRFWILLMKNNNSIKIRPWFQFEVFFFRGRWKKLTFKTLIFENFWGPEVSGSDSYQNWHCVRTLSWFVPTKSTLMHISQQLSYQGLMTIVTWTLVQKKVCTCMHVQTGVWRFSL